MPDCNQVFKGAKYGEKGAAILDAFPNRRTKKQRGLMLP